MEDYSWYSIVKGNEPLRQGDFIDSCPIVVPPKKIGKGNITTEIIEYDVIVPSQSCDIEQEKLELILVCPVWSINEFEGRSDFFRSARGKEECRRGNTPAYHMLSKCDLKGFEKEVQIVDFRSVFGVPFEFVRNFLKRKEERLRLLSPYREHLSQAFARFFMRVGLPVNIPSFTNSYKRTI